ncbi:MULTISPECIES: MBL fold metallo-hydrolase [Cysteiniphilum]|uniref:MBL fold metallo-hydrolase n=1 Tax=Cysteiniphilum TaxID=2056696 RepID=UPI000E355C79|nr:MULTISPECIES: MBL fold metallo-hydrolase [Cysteiniphilum]
MRYKPWFFSKKFRQSNNQNSIKAHRLITKSIGLSVLFSLSFCSLSYGTNSTATCTNNRLSLQLLGSGGPISDDKRASSGEIIWINGKSRILIDAGGGTYLRFGQSGAKLEDLDFIGITHFHTDHVADLPAILKGAEFFKRERPIAIAGPKGNARFPSLTHYLNNLFNAKDGAYAYLSNLLTPNNKDGVLTLSPIINVDYQSPQKTKVFSNAEYTIWALGIPHGNVPALAYRVESNYGNIVISADQNGSNDAFIDFAKGADVLVMPLAIDENADKISSFVHAKPSVVGQIANKVNPKMLVLNHFMGKGLLYKNESIEIVKKYYTGPTVIARDLSSIPLLKN